MSFLSDTKYHPIKGWLAVFYINVQNIETRFRHIDKNNDFI